MVHVRYDVVGLLVEVDDATKLGIQDDLEFFHVLFALLGGGREVGEVGEVGELGCGVRL